MDKQMLPSIVFIIINLLRRLMKIPPGPPLEKGGEIPDPFLKRVAEYLPPSKAVLKGIFKEDYIF
jgi:hypothetical protein